MDGARLSRYPHVAWLGYRFEAPATADAMCWNLQGHAHVLHMVFRGRSPVRWISRGRETRYSLGEGSFHYLPADDESHEIVASPGVAISTYTLFVPRKHLEDSASFDRVDGPIDMHRLLVHDDPVLRACMERLALRPAVDEPALDETARRLVLRLIEASTGRLPDWHDDTSVFDRRTLVGLVDCVDGHLPTTPSLSDMSLRTGLSPSHFARKFRLSTGLSLHRFVNRRRIQRSLDMLTDPEWSLVQIAHDLGFSSQSHFTRLFSDLTGMTPAKYRSQFRPIIG